MARNPLHPSFLCGCNSCQRSYRQFRDREAKKGQASYGRGSASGGYGRGSYSFENATFDGLPALKRQLSGKTEFFYGVNAVGEIDVDDVQHGHAVIRNGKLVYKRRPGESTPVVDRE